MDEPSPGPSLSLVVGQALGACSLVGLAGLLAAGTLWMQDPPPAERRPRAAASPTGPLDVPRSGRTILRLRSLAVVWRISFNTRIAANVYVRRNATLLVLVEPAFRREGNRGHLGGGCDTSSDHH